MRGYCAVCAIFLVFLVVGCSTVTESILVKQEWSENYAAMEGVEATSPLMIDGNRRTVGETEIPVDSEGSTQFTEAVVKLPVEKSIRRVVVYTPNIETFIIYAYSENEEIWKPLEEIKNNEQNKIDVGVSAITDQIKIRVRKTTDDQRIPSERNRWRRVRRANGKIQEIEIYGLVEEQEEEVVEESAELSDELAQPATFVAPTSYSQETAASTKTDETTAGISDIEGQKTKTTTEQTVQIKPKSSIQQQKTPPKPQNPPAAVSLKSSESTYSLTDPIPVTVDIKIGPDDLVVLEDHVKDDMLCTKLVVRSDDGKKIPCSKPTPKLSPARPYRSSGRPVEVRNAKTLEAETTVTLEIPNLLELYPIEEPGTYTVQFNTVLPVYSIYVGRYKTQIDDLQASIRDINTNPSLSQSDKASVTQDMRVQVEELKKRKDHRYIVVGSRGKSLKLTSNTLELAIQ